MAFETYRARREERRVLARIRRARFRQAEAPDASKRLFFTGGALVAAATVLAACSSGDQAPPLSPDKKWYWKDGKWNPMPGTGPTGTPGTPDAGQSPDAGSADLPVSREQARDRFGVGPRSLIAKNWSVTNEGPRNHTFALADDTANDQHTRLNTAGFTFDGWIKMSGGPGNQALFFVASGRTTPQIDVMGGTMRFVEGQSSEKTEQDVFAERNAFEIKTQPGVLRIPVGFRPEGCSTEVTDLGHIKTASDARDQWGNPDDPYTMDEKNWKLIYDGPETVIGGNVRGFALKKDNSGKTHRIIKLGGAVVQGYLDIKDDGTEPYFAAKTPGYRSIAFTANGSVVTEMDGREFTVWARENPTTANVLHLYTVGTWANQKRDEEMPADQGGQPGAIDLLLGADSTKLKVC